VWFWIWTALVAASLVWAFFWSRYLWRTAAKLLQALEGLSQALARLENASFDGVPLPALAVSTETTDLLARLEARQQRLTARSRRRWQRHQAVYDRWAVLAGYRDKAQ
jgi:hypothetical protein